MMRPLAFFLTALLLLQSFGRERLVLNFAVNPAAIAAKYSANKARPRLHCDGKCDLARQLPRAENDHPKAPISPLAAVKAEVAAPGSLQPTQRAWAGRAIALRYAPLAARPDAAAPLGGVFHPPTLLG